MTDWKNSVVLKFLEYYRRESCIWNPSHSDYKDKHKKIEAWQRLSKLMNKPIKELKYKKEILMVTFRKHLKRKQECFQFGDGIEEIYVSTWFAYELMESFLLPIYASKLGLESIVESMPTYEVTVVDESEEMETQESLAGTSAPIPVAEESLECPSVLADSVSEPEESMECPVTLADSVSAIEESVAGPSTLATSVSPPVTKSSMVKSVYRNASSRQGFTKLIPRPQQSNSDDDECYLYAKLLAKKMRELPTDERKFMMYKIDGLFIEKIKQRTLSSMKHKQKRSTMSNGS